MNLQILLTTGTRTRTRKQLIPVFLIAEQKKSARGAGRRGQLQSPRARPVVTSRSKGSGSLTKSKNTSSKSAPRRSRQKPSSATTEPSGWQIGATPVRHWQALADKWLIESAALTPTKVKSKHPAGRLHVDNNKNYAEPL